MKKLRHIKSKRLKYKQIFAYVGALLFVTVLLCLIFGWRLSNTIWLPDTAKYANASDDEVLFDLPIRGETVATKYGRANRYTSDDGWQTIYEFRSSPLLKSSSCPNILSAETLLSSECKEIGTFQNQSVYTIHRSLPSGTTEYFVKVGQTFIFIKSRGDGGESLDYLNTFVKVPRNKVSSYLSESSKRVNAVKAKQQAEKEATDKNKALAYTRLDFTPAIPTNLPSGWQLNTNVATNPIQLDGPDADHPNMVNLEYTNNSKKFVSVHSGKLSNFVVGTQCGPSPGYLMENLACHKVPGTDYYEATLYGERNDFVRYLYRPVGDSLVISHIVIYADGGKPPGFPTELARIQDAITSSAEPTDKNTLKGSTYYKLYY